MTPKGAHPMTLSRCVFLGTFALFGLAVAVGRPDEPTFKGRPAAFWQGRLKDTDATVRREGVTALATLGPAAASAVPALIEAMRDSDMAVRSGAVVALGKIGPAAKEAVPALLKAADDTDSSYRESVFVSMGVIAPEDERVQMASARAFLDPDKRQRSLKARLIFDRSGPKSKAVVPILLEAVNSDDPARSSHALAALTRFGPDAAPILLPLVKDKDGKIRPGILGALKTLGPDARPALPILKEAVEKEQEAAVAIRVLAAIGPEAVPFLAETLTHPNGQVGKLAAEALHDLASQAKPAIPALIAALEDRQVGGSANQALIAIGEEAVPALLEAIGKPKRRELAFRALQEMGPRAASATPELIPMLKDEARAYKAANVLAVIGADAVPAVLAAMEDLDNDWAGRVIVLWRDKDTPFRLAMPGLVKLLNHKDPQLRLRAARTFEEIGPPVTQSPQSVAALREALKDPDAKVRTAVERALKRIRPEN